MKRFNAKKTGGGIVGILIFGVSTLNYVNSNDLKVEAKIDYIWADGAEGTDRFGPFTQAQCEANMATYLRNIETDGGRVLASECSKITQPEKGDTKWRALKRK